MPLTILVDSREAKLKKYFVSGTRSNQSALVSFQGLDIGDVQLRNSENDEIMYIIERKSISDFYSSINDGRYREQKARILGSVTNKARVAYIVEGNILDTSLNLNELQRRIVQAAIVNLQLRDKITIYRTSNAVETGMYVDLIYKKLTENPQWIADTTCESGISDVPTPGYNHLVKTAKRENLTPNICQKVQLAQIPGVSASTADIILAKYDSLVSLINTYQQIPESEINTRELLLATLQMTPKRKLGKVLSTRIYKYLFNISEN